MKLTKLTEEEHINKIKEELRMLLKNADEMAQKIEDMLEDIYCRLDILDEEKKIEELEEKKKK